MSKIYNSRNFLFPKTYHDKCFPVNLNKTKIEKLNHFLMLATPRPSLEF